MPQLCVGSPLQQGTSLVARQAGLAVARSRRASGGARCALRCAAMLQEGNLTDAEVQAFREDTPGCRNVQHFNNAGAALPPYPVIAAVSEHLQLEAEIGGYEAAERAATVLQRPYHAIAAMLNCDAEEIAIVTSATAAWQQVVYGLALQRGDRILTFSGEYGSNYISFLQIARRTGAVVEVVPDGSDGDVDAAALAAACARRPTPALIALSHVPTGSGRVYEAAAVGRVAAAAGVPFLLDACQSVGQLPLDVRALRCDWLSGTGRKYLRGPRGSGFLFASRAAMERQEPAFLDVWGAQWSGRDSYALRPGARRYESYESSFAAKVGLGVAVDYALSAGQARCWQRISALAADLRTALDALPDVSVWDSGRQLCGIVTFTKETMSAESLRAALACTPTPINVSVSRAPSTRLLFEAAGVEEVVRASVHYYNTTAEIEALVRAVAEAK